MEIGINSDGTIRKDGVCGEGAIGLVSVLSQIL